MTTQSTSLRLADSLSVMPFVWPGGYPRYGVTSNGDALCHRCCKSERESIGTTTGTDGWRLIGTDVNWEDSELRCDHCGEQIESAYGDTES